MALWVGRDRGNEPALELAARVLTQHAGGRADPRLGNRMPRRDGCRSNRTFHAVPPYFQLPHSTQVLNEPVVVVDPDTHASAWTNVLSDEPGQRKRRAKNPSHYRTRSAGAEIGLFKPFSVEPRQVLPKPADVDPRG